MTKEDLDNLVKENDAIMIYFSGQNCGVCKVLQPQIKELLDENYPKIVQHYLEAEEEKELCASLGIFAVPTLIIYFDGKEFIRKSRNFSALELDKDIQRPYGLFFD